MRALILILLFTLPGGLPAARIPPGAACMPNQPQGTVCLVDQFAAYWRSNGGLPVFGYAISEAQAERSGDTGQEFLTQWTERNRLELHPENKAPYDILLGRMGAERLRQIGRDPAAEGREAGPATGCLWFEQTGHNVCDQARGQGFKTDWQTHGLKSRALNAYQQSLALFGLPLTAAQPERDANGEMVVTQWFERARFEWRPDNPAPYRVQLGLLGAELRNGPPTAPTSIFGLNMTPGYVSASVERAAAARATWLHYGGVIWSDIERTPGMRDWSQMAAAEAELKTIAARGMTAVVPVRSTPDWAQQVRGHSCGAIKPAALDAFAAFMRDLVARYSAPPYSIKYWEIWNEPDVDPSLVGPTSGFGCWGDESDPYYGGGAYAEMLKRVYPAIKQANPDAQVLLGGMLMDCDSGNPPPGQTCPMGRFFEGVLRNGGGAFFDIVSYHGYAFWTGKLEDWDAQYKSWDRRGGSMRGKLQFLREVMAQYQVKKPVMLTETALLCFQARPGCRENFFNAQANHVVRTYARALANDLIGAIWYTLEEVGWEKSGLLDERLAPRPAYQTMVFLSGLLTGASYDGPRSNGPVEGYAFRRGAVRYEIYWTNTDMHVPLPLPAGARAAYSYLGAPIPLGGPTIDVNFNPIVIELT